MKNKKIFFLILISFLIILISYLLLGLNTSSNKFSWVKSLFDNKQKQLIMKYVFPYKFISIQEKKILQGKKHLEQKNYVLDFMMPRFLKMESELKKSGASINLSKKDQLNLKKDYILKKYSINDGFYIGINNKFPGSGYIDFYQKKLLILSSRGVITYGNLNNLEDETIFKQIKNNIDEFIDIDEYFKERRLSIKDLSIIKDEIYISYSEEIKKNCWTTSIIFGKLSFDNIQFEKLFSPGQCVNSLNEDNEFNPVQAGGRIIEFDSNHILFSIGDYRLRHLSQNKKSIFGKIIKINTENKKFEILSMGHRNPQGLLYDKENNFIISTEHGPRGGDEINIIDIESIYKNEEILNFGWAISSYGEHYGEKKQNKTKYEKYPLYKSHSKHGFIEPIKSFVPSIGIAENVKIGDNKYVLSSMRDRSIYFFNLDQEKNIINFDRVEVFERVRDLKFHDNKLYLFMEDTASIGIIDLI